MGRLFLFSIDLEDVRLGVKDGESYKDSVPYNTLAYLKWLNKYNFKCTFFTTGHIAKMHPSLIKEIVAEGHEIACHTTNHIPLDKQSPFRLKEDLEENINLLLKAGVKLINGFRAPIFSLTEKTKWAYEVLEELGFSYSSSVLPIKNPLYGWENFGVNPKKMGDKIIEIPMTIGKIGPLSLPFAGGIYFRTIPFFIKKYMLNKRDENLPIIGYFHPYDIDTTQEKFMHSGINNNIFYNKLMYYNRKNVLKQLDLFIELGFEICTYNDFIKTKLI